MFTVDLRSDTVTRPSDAMKKAMMESPLAMMSSVTTRP